MAVAKDLKIAIVDTEIGISLGSYSHYFAQEEERESVLKSRDNGVCVCRPKNGKDSFVFTHSNLGIHNFIAWST